MLAGCGDDSLAFAVAACTCLYVINFAYSWGPLAWLVRERRCRVAFGRRSERDADV